MQFHYTPVHNNSRDSTFLTSPCHNQTNLSRTVPAQTQNVARPRLNISTQSITPTILSALPITNTNRRCSLPPHCSTNRYHHNPEPRFPSPSRHNDALRDTFTSPNHPSPKQFDAAHYRHATRQLDTATGRRRASRNLTPTSPHIDPLCLHRNARLATKP